MSVGEILERNAGKIAGTIIGLLIAASVLYIAATGGYSGTYTLIMIVVGILPLMIVLFGDRLLNKMSEGDSFSVSARGVSISYKKKRDQAEKIDSTISDTRTNYDLLLTIIRSRDEATAREMEATIQESDHDSLKEIATIINNGMKDPIRETDRILAKNIALRDYISATGEDYPEVVTYERDKYDHGAVFAELEVNPSSINDELVFEVYRARDIEVRGESESLHESVAKAEIRATHDSGLSELEITEWEEGVSPETRENLINLQPQVRISEDGIRQIEWDGIEEAHNYLDQAQPRER